MKPGRFATALALIQILGFELFEEDGLEAVGASMREFRDRPWVATGSAIRSAPIRSLQSWPPYFGAPGSSVGKASFRDYLEDNPASLELLDHLRSAIRTLGPTKELVTKSQVAFKSKKAFAWAWAPEQYLGKGAPLVLTVSLPFRDRSSRWKEIVESSPGRFTHHLELKSTSDIDAEVLRWLQTAHQLLISR